MHDPAALWECWRLFRERVVCMWREQGVGNSPELLHYRDKAKWLLWSCGEEDRTMNIALFREGLEIEVQFQNTLTARDLLL